MTAIQLSEQQRAELLKVLGHFAPPVDRVDVYGSRATGRARPGSDVDLVVAGVVDRDILRRISMALEDSYLSIYADVTAYGLLKADAFAENVRRSAVPLFDAAALAGAPPFRPVDGLLSWYTPIAAPAPAASPVPPRAGGRGGR